MQPAPPAPGAPRRLVIRALLVGERLDLRGLTRAAPSAADPLPIAVPGAVAAFVLRWGALVLVGASKEAEAVALAALAGRIVSPLTPPIEEQATLLIGGQDGVAASGEITLSEADHAHLALVADALAKSAALAQQESALAGTLDGMDPVVTRLRRTGRVGVTSRSLLRAVGAALDARSRATARIDPEGRPDVLWDNPGLARLHARLAEEFELRERAAELDRKLALIGETVQSLLSIIEARRSLGLEIAIATMIAIEVVATIYDVVAK
jgi:uncharacterized Rmd1/YagE family protein